MSNTSSRKHRVFVYGTLMRGGRNHHKMNGAQLISENALTKEQSFLMLQFNSSSSGEGFFSPGVSEKGNGFIQGDVYEVDDEGLQTLHDLEGYDPELPDEDNKYLCKDVTVIDSKGNQYKVLIYIINSDKLPSTQQDRISFENDTYSWKCEDLNLT